MCVLSAFLNGDIRYVDKKAIHFNISNFLVECFKILKF